MSRLADYFVVVGYDHEKERSGQSCGRIIQRFPEKDWDDCPFTQGIDLFCQPAGWELSSVRQQPTFFVSVLTDIDADRHYCACLTFNEGVTMAPKDIDDEEADDEDNSLVRHSVMFAPKSLVLVSRVDCFETFRNCLGLIYTVYLENIQVHLETLIGNILGCIQVPPPGGPQVRFSIGAGDRQCLQPPLSPTLPVTRFSINTLFQQLGINNTLSVFSAAVTDCKVLFHSQSYSRLTDACQAITALMYPLKYSYVYIPLLPAGLIEVLSTPTPFIAGVHSSLKPEFSELVSLDVVIADLDGGSIHIPECVQLSVIPEPHYSRLVSHLTLILKFDLLNADVAYPPPQPRPPMPEMQDKEIRAVLLRFFGELWFGYRSCLTIIRIHPEPFITFHKANFLGHRGLVEEDFVTKVLDGMAFGTFVAERGPPYRVCDIFDEVFASMPEVLKEEECHPEKVLPHIKDLATQLYINENPNPQPYVQKIPKPPDGAHNRIHQPQFPIIDWVHVQEIIDEGVAKHSIKSKLTQMRPMQQRIVPMGPHITSSTDKHNIVTNYARRLEVLQNCITFIFENKISDARKVFPAVLRALKGRMARQALVQELNFHVQSNRAMLEHQQFDLVVRLLNNALQNDSSMDENGIAAAILPLATAFCRKLCTGVIQFVYTCIQEHAVWSSQSFWESAFYQDVQKEIRGLYAPQYEENFLPEKEPNMSPASFRDRDTWSRESWKGGTITPDSQRRSVTSASTIFKPREISALEIAAEQLRVWSTLSSEEQKEMINNEESTVYSQAIHYANRMVYMRVPLDASKQLKNAITGMEESNSSNITNSLAESDSFDAESGFDEQEVTEVGSSVVRFVTRFVDKVCTESGVTDDHIKSLHQMIPGVVAMHIETLEGVHRESRRLPPIQKPKILTPTLLPGEEIVMEGLRVYLIPDGREEGAGCMGGPILLPAEGAVFLTTYRIIFKGTPCDPLVCEHIICRCFPVSTLTREKKISVQYLSHIEQWMQEGLQLRSNTFQLMKIAFDEEVGSENIETFRKLLNKVRNPPSVLSTFAFTGGLVIQATPLHKHKEKNSTLKGFTKKTLLRTARKVGLKSKDPNRKQKYIMPTPPLPRRTLLAMETQRDRPHSISCDEELSVIEENDLLTAIQTDSKNIERLADRPYCRDYQRLGLGSLVNNPHTRSRSDPFRLSLVNTTYSISRSYPAVIVVPQSVSDDSIRKFARSHRQYRFPVVVWRHPKTRAVLLRASGFHGKSVMGMLKSQHTTSTSGSETSTSLEQEKYFSALVAATPAGNPRFTPSSNTSDSLTSLDSLMLSTATVDSLVTQTPDTSRKNPLSRAVSSLRHSGGKVKLTPGEVLATPIVGRKKVNESSSSSSANPFTRTFGSFRLSGGKGGKPLGRLGSYRDRRYTTGSLQSGISQTGLKQNGTLDSSEMYDLSANNFHKAALYVLGEKTQMKGIKLESFPKCDFIPVEFYDVRHVKSSFKKLMKVCVPSAGSNDAQAGSFYKALEDSDWLPQLQSILQIAGATVDLLDVQGSSVLICLEDGWDFTTQVISVAQLLMDPYYRTIEGFQTLVQKEWLSFGHRFTHRSNQTAANQASGFAPVFLQFLDVVHQIHHQFPLSFEFNQFYLRFLAYHYVSNRFRTFMLDNECERMESGWLLDEKKVSSPMDEGGSPKHQPGLAVWDFIMKHHKRSSVFYNFMYSPRDQDMVLRPYSNISNLRIWDYFIKEDLNHGPPYDLDVVAKEARQEEEQDLVDGTMQPGARRIINACYHNMDHLQPNSFTWMFQEIHRLEMELETSQQKWRHLWEKLEMPRQEQLTRQVSFNTQIVRSHGRSIHKRSTIELLVRGKMLGEASRMFSQPHHFEKYTYTTPAYCDYCNHVLWGLVRTGMKCSDCGYNCHEKCTSHVPKNCTKLKPVSEDSDNTLTDAKANMADAAATSSEHRTHEGYLYKRGARLKGWKQRWFVLDSMKHQLRYYDEKEDTHCKGFTDLAEVISVIPIKSVQGATKKSDEGAFFEIKTQKRLYNFMAPDRNAAQEWIDKIQSCLQ